MSKMHNAMNCISTEQHLSMKGFIQSISALSIRRGDADEETFGYLGEDVPQIVILTRSRGSWNNTAISRDMVVTDTS